MHSTYATIGYSDPSLMIIAMDDLPDCVVAAYREDDVANQRYHRLKIYRDDAYEPTEIIGIGDDAPAPQLVTRLGQNYPNPFNPRTAVDVEVSATGQVSLTVYDVTGRAVRRLVKGVLMAGRYKFEWDGRNELGERAASGVYICRLETGGKAMSRKMIMIR